jgi:signal peptidase I
MYVIKNKYLKLLFRVLYKVVMALCVLIIIYYLGRIFICDQFVVPSQSMSPTLMAGDRILVNKLVFGARIYKNFDFSKDKPLKSWRTFGFGKISPNDVIVFNYPKGYNRNKIEFKINYVYVKRCVGTPGDTVCIVNGFYKNNNYKSLLGIYDMQKELSMLADTAVLYYSKSLMPFYHKNYGWTIKNTTPLLVPKNGIIVSIDSINYKIYKQVIEYETGKTVTMENGVVMLDYKQISEYMFAKNYYFACGDNVLNSFDSRYWGFIPEEFIIGVATRITYSKYNITGKLREGRTWKKIK